MEIPSKIRVGSFDYDVELTDETLVLNASQCLGIIDCDKLKIKVARNIQSKQKQEQTFLHEVVHAIVKEYKVDFTEDEETIVDKVSCGLHQVIRDNFHEIITVGNITIKHENSER
ncbi:hypothetical protein NE172_10810 [Clostridium botulinum]|uniref:Phage protein n=1 Tax=Clostridium botulinum TaxID=1491 RepID=A0A6B4JNX3_CLOBO|nr:hypothetical protein [Clostridium botulinum]EES48692.1 phage protein, putative [Clostridium botulinum E1 str. 'BoNT E Beluga']MBY6761873.1 hypothetical protein [Clostridium botulinum]MBY6920799.1 hypothetical protein [Clostridium botulinum]MCR1131452.1 hypothetical protein [Clostridium botulinum]NFJ58642.1 hypothetical protein [Clostridium botulinum]